MSAESKDSKTEKPTPHRLREVRKKGQVAQSKEITSVFIMLFATIYFWVAWEGLLEKFKQLMSFPSIIYEEGFVVAMEAMWIYTKQEFIYPVILPFSVFMMFAGILGNILQFGIIFSFEPIKPTLDKINPIKGVERIFSVKQLVKVVFSILKVIVATIIIYFLVRMTIFNFMHDVGQCDVPCQLDLTEIMISYIVIALLILLIILAMLDLIFQKNQFLKDQKMSKEEIKREVKQQEGDPHIKGRRKSDQREMMNQDIGEKIKKSRVIVAGSNLTVALQFDDDTPLPIILAIAKGDVARRMITIAKKEKVPVHMDGETAKILDKDGHIDQYIPRSSIQGVVRAIKSTEQAK